MYQYNFAKVFSMKHNDGYCSVQMNTAALYRKFSELKALVVQEFATWAQHRPLRRSHNNRW